jgi:hypothetical protein
LPVKALRQEFGTFLTDLPLPLSWENNGAMDKALGEPETRQEWLQTRPSHPASLRQWYPQGGAQVKPEVERLQRFIGRKTKDLGSYFTCALVGILLSPPDATLSKVDNLVWLIGAYVEKEEMESALTYPVAAN